MNIQFWTIGKVHELYVSDGINDFTKRLNNYFNTSWKIIPSSKYASSLSEPDLKKKEAEAVFAALAPTDYLVALDERGKMLSSSQLSTFLQQRTNESVRNIVFLIGGAYGIDESLLQRANFRWSLSPLTFPHQLVRLILSEQIYRACTIMRNEKYHHG